MSVLRRDFRRFLSTFVEPVSHTILYGLVKAWLDLICDTKNEIFINGVRFVLSGKLLEQFNDVISGVKLSSAYNRPAQTLAKTAGDGCVSIVLSPDNLLPFRVCGGCLVATESSACWAPDRMHMMQSNCCHSMVFRGVGDIHRSHWCSGVLVHQGRPTYPTTHD